jgi:ubiquitin-activating enzyme E1
LLKVFPENQINENGIPFWSYDKRVPKVIKFDSSNQTHLEFIESVVRILSFIYNIKMVSIDELKARLDKVVVPEQK